MNKYPTISALLNLLDVGISLVLLSGAVILIVSAFLKTVGLIDALMRLGAACGLISGALAVLKGRAIENE